MKVRLQGSAAHASVGWAEDRGRTRSEVTIDPSAISIVRDGVRYFLDGALVGILRSLKARKVIGNLVVKDSAGIDRVDDEIFIMEPDWEGGFISAAESAAQFCMDLSQSGFYVIAPTFLAFDTLLTQYVWRSKDASPATHTDEFAVLIPPHASADLRELAFRKESGG